VCGIAGIVSARDGGVSAERLVRMRDAMAHRGPDGVGVWHDPARRVGLAHRRLAIVDLSPAGAQPMATDDGSVQVVCNGEIYNHLGLRQELISLGARFRSRSDTEVLVHGWRAWGDRLLDRLVGMFAFAIWDEVAGELIVVRDRIGVKPVYFRESGGELLFASEIKGLLADPAVPRELDPIAARQYLTFVVPPAPLTMFRGIFKLPAGHLLRVRPGAPARLTRWWDPVSAPPADVDPKALRDDDACAAEWMRRLDRSIERRMMSDVPFGVFLSGGLDSSVNVALMARHMDRPVATFSVGFKDHPGYNELDYARLIAKEFGTEHREVEIDAQDAIDYLPQLVVEQDEPIADWVCVPLHFVAKLARESGVPVVQLGEGADELLCGYDHFRPPIDAWRRYVRGVPGLPEPLRRAAVGLATYAGTFSPAWARRARLAESFSAGREPFLGGAICFDEDERAALLACDAAPRTDDPAFLDRGLLAADPDAVVKTILAPFRAANAPADVYPEMLYLELRHRLPELLLMRLDKILMAVSVEGRDPYLDHELVAFAMALPLRMRLRDGVGKWIHKRAARGLVPDAVIDRPKVGFAAPVREWLRGPFGRWARARLDAAPDGLFRPAAVSNLFDLHLSGRADRSFHIWTALNLALWHERWIAGTRV
jgi:asparagine synthase (glutamine-hydrolysing)